MNIPKISGMNFDVSGLTSRVEGIKSNVMSKVDSYVNVNDLKSKAEEAISSKMNMDIPNLDPGTAEFEKLMNSNGLDIDTSILDGITFL